MNFYTREALTAEEVHEQFNKSYILGEVPLILKNKNGKYPPDYNLQG